jgi:hypothetical protein
MHLLSYIVNLIVSAKKVLRDKFSGNERNFSEYPHKSGFFNYANTFMQFKH